MLARYKERLRADLGDTWLAADCRDENVVKIRAFLDAERDALARQFEAEPSGGAYCGQHSALFDTVLSTIFSMALAEVERRDGPLPMDADLCVAAVGGYGRAHMAPWSDIDLVFVPMVEEHVHIDAIIREMLTLMGQVLVPLKHPHVAHSYRPLTDLGYIDHQSATALLESRFVAGDMSLYMHFMQEVMNSISPVEFTHVNVGEREAVWRSRRQSLFAVEPNLKSGPGGLRDFHAAVWVAKVVFRVSDWDVLGTLQSRGIVGEQERAETLNALEFILRARNWLHLRRGQKLDVLHKPYQQEMALGLGYRDHERVAAAEDLMRDYYRSARALADFSRRLLAVCRDQRMDFRHGCYVEHWRLEPAQDTVFRDDPERIVALFGEAQTYGLGMSMRCERLIQLSAQLLDAPVLARKSVGERFLAMLRPERDIAGTLRDMLRLRVLERLLPEFEPMLPFLPTDQAHEYTVGEHSIKVVEELQRVMTAPAGEDEAILADAIEHLQEPEVLFFAALYHDVGKLDGTGDHSTTGIERARVAAERVGLQEHQIERLSFLIREHLTMMRTARLKPLQMQDTIDDFVEKLPTRDPVDALDMLTCLTYADTRSVGENVLKDTDRRLLMELFAKAARWVQERPLDDATDPDQAGRARRRLTRAPALKDMDPELVRTHLERLPVWYAVNTPPALVAKHIAYLDRLGAGEDPVVEFYQALGAKHTELTLCTGDRPGLLRDIAGTITANNLDIYLCQQDVAGAVGDDGVRQAICTIWLDDFGQSVTQGKRDRLAEDLSRVVRGEQTVSDLLAKRGRRQVDVVVHSVEVSSEASRQYTVVSIRAADERGLLFRLADALNEEDLDIRVAKVTTWRNAAEDAFYVVSSKTGGKVPQEDAEAVGRRIAGHLSASTAADAGEPA